MGKTTKSGGSGSSKTATSSSSSSSSKSTKSGSIGSMGSGTKGGGVSKTAKNTYGPSVTKNTINENGSNTQITQTKAKTGIAGTSVSEVGRSTKSPHADIPDQVRNTMTPQPMPHFVPEDNGAAPSVTIEVLRHPDSMSTVNNKNFQNLGLDKVILFNHDTGESVTLTMQTVSTRTGTAGGTLAPGSFEITRGAVGGTSLFGDNDPRPLAEKRRDRDDVMTITGGRTMDGAEIRDSGIAYENGNRVSDPYRVHRDVNDAKGRYTAGPTSAGCFTDMGEGVHVMNATLERWGIRRGDTVTGNILQL